MASVKLEIKGARSVVVMILDNGPSDRGSVPREVRLFFLNLKLEVRRVNLWSDNDEFGITRVHYIEVQLCY